MGVSESIVVYQFSVCAGVLLREIGSETAMVKEGKHDKDKNILCAAGGAAGGSQKAGAECEEFKGSSEAGRQILKGICDNGIRFWQGTGHLEKVAYPLFFL